LAIPPPPRYSDEATLCGSNFFVPSFSMHDLFRL